MSFRFVVVLALCGRGVLASAQADGEDSGGLEVIPTRVHGVVFVLDPDELGLDPLIVGRPMPAGHRIITGQDSFVDLCLTGGGLIRLSEASELVFEGAEELSYGRKFDWELTRGSLLEDMSIVDRKTFFELRTSTLVIGASNSRGRFDASGVFTHLRGLATVIPLNPIKNEIDDIWVPGGYTFTYRPDVPAREKDWRGPMEDWATEVQHNPRYDRFREIPDTLRAELEEQFDDLEHSACERP